MFTCIQCDYHTYHSGNMKEHVRRHVGNKPYKCQLCSYESARSSDLKRHEQTVHRSNTKLNNKRIEICILFKVIHTISIALFFFSDFVICQYCLTSLPKSIELILDHCKKCHFSQRIDFNHLYTCVLCQYHSNSRYNMRFHIRVHLGERPFKCLQCPYSSTQVSNLKSHMQIKH
ncbi:zinc finger protein 64 homolog, isoforms 3 and 4-like [Diaphorina citri]|uniref:Zinc finger protein 64 homolog, isoforms 3 and 4-like n=1 Tax=Diaphorina citri TaxID=121845 RepID=A0A3Q0J5J3_DIACI|nr:zinc finger protein 64 homolog, isoforms 3 and 4-like [Diaphorina citri]